MEFSWIQKTPSLTSLEISHPKVEKKECGENHGWVSIQGAKKG